MPAVEKGSRRVSYSHDREGDVLYLTIGAAKPGYCRGVDDGILLRLDGLTDDVCGATILDFLKRDTRKTQMVLPFKVNLNRVRRSLGGD